jgi:hypothetical protein
MTVGFFGFTDLAESVAVIDDGKIVVAGQARDDVDGYWTASAQTLSSDPRWMNTPRFASAVGVSVNAEGCSDR